MIIQPEQQISSHPDQFKPRVSMKYKLGGALILAILLSTIFLVVGTIFVNYSQFKQENQRQLLRATQGFLHQWEKWVEPGRLFHSFRIQKGEISLLIVDPVSAVKNEIPLPINLPEISKDFDVDFTIYELEGRKVTGFLNLPLLSNKTKGQGNILYGELQDTENNHYDFALIPLKQGEQKIAFLVASINQDRTFKRIHETVTLLLWISVGMLCFIVTSSLIFVDQFMRPINRLTSFAQQIKAGNFDQEIHIQGNDELSILAQSFMQMRNAIRQQFTIREQEIHERKEAEKQLALLNYELEERVKERTEALNQANSHLQQEMIDGEQSLDLMEKINALKEEFLKPAQLRERLQQITEGAQRVFQASYVQIWLLQAQDQCVAHDVCKNMSPQSTTPQNLKCLFLAASATQEGIDALTLPPGIPLSHKTTKQLLNSTKTKFLDYDLDLFPFLSPPGFPEEDNLKAFSVYRILSPEQETVGLLSLFRKQSFSVYEDVQLESLTSTVSNLIQRSKVEEKLKETQLHLLRAEKLSALGKLVAGVAHEINTPIGVAVTAASFLEETSIFLSEAFEKGTLTKGAMEEFLKGSLSATTSLLFNLERASELIVNFKQVAVDQSHENKRSFNFRNYLDGIIVSLSPDLNKTKHKVTLLCPTDLIFESYPGVFSQIIANFVMNSLLHAFESIEQGAITIEVTQKPGELQLIYRDNGKGMEDINVQKVFDPFHTTKRNRGGTGLGMHIVFTLVTQKLNGRITCSSKLGQGTEFLITLPWQSSIET
ncbi:MAG: hypothetical protein COB67_12405 [SAR324 cluster bacterium]|uniref:histidine kinase n=1 Tax=SAR324 cluster bacterium TaxID=2024889 RepID=A0A2A4SRC3_9DELT|nr:MAG: hypothetical protein COB67_12405 [SAR324 cluster bacterium]